MKSLASGVFEGQSRTRLCDAFGVGDRISVHPYALCANTSDLFTDNSLTLVAHLVIQTHTDPQPDDFSLIHFLQGSSMSCPPLF